MDIIRAQRESLIIVDDSKLNLEISKQVLKDDYNVYTAESGVRLFELLDSVVPFLILLDIAMPEMDGYEVNRMLKMNEKTAKIPVIFLTAATDNKSEAMALKDGVVDYITKPIAPDILKMRVAIQLLIKNQHEELTQSIKSAELANSEKSAFIATMSHEMRTPLNAIIGFSELSLEENNLSEKVRSNFVNIRRAGTTLLNIISDILDISKIGTGKLELVPVEYDTADLINDSLIQSILHKGDKNVKFNFKIASDFPTKLYGDELRVRQVFNNLLSNAFKYTMQGSVSLSLECEYSGDNVIIFAKIEDTGLGIKEEDLEHIFDEYVQADMRANRTIVGTGLGLPISKKLATLMGGDVNIESEYGKGCIFTAKIIQEFVTAEPIAPEVVDDIKNFRYTEKSQNDFQNQLQLSLPYARILVVDDVDTNLAVAKGLLNRYSIKADCVLSGPEAIEHMKNSEIRYDAIFMDHMMPGMDGIEATALIREIDSDYARKIPIIAFTANAIVGNEEMFLNEGFQAYISKPIDLSRLDAIIRKWVRNADKEAEMHSAHKIVPIEQEQESNEISIKGFKISGVDIEEGLKHFAGDEKIYMSVLRTFAQNVPEILKNVEQKITDMEEYTINVHGIKGSCYGICAFKSAALADALEAASKINDRKFVKKHNPAFIEHVKKLLEDIKKVLDRIDESIERGEKNNPDKELLKELKEACQHHDMNAVDEIVNELCKYEYVNDGYLIKWIKEMSDRMNYDEIAAILE
ncbi:MAG: response regulator [Defluviitaleaceae bacterium]|nr:response regulator [Defluviitaleaceae bacterium]